MTLLTKETFYNIFSFFVSSNILICDVSIKLRPYGGLIGIKNCSLEKYLSDSKSLVTIARFLHDAAGFNY